MSTSPSSGLVDPALQLGHKYTLNSRNVVSSAYWKVPDSKAHLTSVACHETDPLVAVASGTRDSNLFIYEVNAPQDDRRYPSQSDGYYNYPSNYGDEDILDYYDDSPRKSPSIKRPKKHLRSVSGTSFISTSSASSSGSSQHSSPVLTHHQTISLGGIYSLAWVSSQNHQGSYGNVLATGHNSGLLNLVLLPDPYANNGPAEILSRFNHARHISSELISSSRIRNINLTNSSWSCCAPSSIVSLFSEHLFMWDPTRSKTPVIIQRAHHVRSHHISPMRNGIVSLATDRGISIMDLRYKNPSALAPPTGNDGHVSLVKWSPLDANRVASVHDENLIKIWDIRAGAPLVTLEGHYDKINSIEWSTNDTDEFYSASADGTVRMWDIKKCTINDKNRLRRQTRIASAPAPPVTSKSTQLRRAKSTSAAAEASADWLPSQSWRLYRQRLARENSLPSYNYFLDNQNPQSPCTTIFSNNKEFLSLSIVQMPAHSGQDAPSTPHLVSIDNNGFFGIHSRVNQEPSGKGESDQDINTPYKATSSKSKSTRNSLDSLASLSSTSAGEPDLDRRLDEDSSSDTDLSFGHASPQHKLQEFPFKSTTSEQKFSFESSTPRRTQSYGAYLSPSKTTGTTKPLNFVKSGYNDEYMIRKLSKSFTSHDMSKFKISAGSTR